MMKQTILSKALCALLMTGALVSACSHDDDEAPQAINVIKAGKTYSLTVEATKGGNEEAARATRALTDGNDKIFSTWKTGELVYVFYNHGQDVNVQFEGYLEAKRDGATTTLNGNLKANNDISTPILVTMLFPQSDWSYKNQKGTLKDIADHYDFATASIELHSVKEDSVTAAKSVTFTNQQAIVKFTLQDKNNSNAALKASSLRISATGLKTGETETGDITITPESETSEFYAALRGINGAKVTLTATVGSDTYTYTTKEAVTFKNGSFWDITVKMQKVLTYPVALAQIYKDYIGSVVGQNGYVYPSATAATTAGTTAVAMIAYVDNSESTAHGLAIALTDESGTMNQSEAKTAASTTKNTNTPVSNGSWDLPTLANWQDMFVGCGGNGTSDCSAFNSKLGSVGTALQKGSTGYWAPDIYTNYISITESTASPAYDQVGISCYVRACLAF